jgi:hypothetical protein
MSIRNTALPEFSPAMRGFDRRQVMDYLQRLREYAAELEERSALAEQALADERAEVERLRTALAAGGPPDPPPVAAEDPPDVGAVADALRAEIDHLRRARSEALEDLLRLGAQLTATVRGLQAPLVGGGPARPNE